MQQVPLLEQKRLELETAISNFRTETADTDLSKSQRKQLKRLENQIAERETQLESIRVQIRSLEDDAKTSRLIAEYPHIERDILQETAKLHAGDRENKKLSNLII